MEAGNGGGSEEVFVLKIKRRIDEDPLPFMYEKETALYYRLENEAALSTPLPTHIMTDGKRRKVIGTLVSLTADVPEPAAAPIEDELGFTVDFYHPVPTSAMLVGVPFEFIGDVVLDDSCLLLEDDYGDGVDEEDEDDSNAEDYYANDYPDEDDGGRDYSGFDPYTFDSPPDDYED